MPGRYYLHCAARANGPGAFVYLLIDGKKELIEIWANGNTKGNIFSAARGETNRISREMKAEKISKEEAQKRLEPLRNMAIANGGKGYGWNRLSSNVFDITKPTAVKYGLTSDYQFTGQPFRGQWFSACDFVFEKIE